MFPQGLKMKPITGETIVPPLVINTAVETEMNTRTTKVMVQPVSGSQNLRTFMIMLG